MTRALPRDMIRAAEVCAMEDNRTATEIIEQEYYPTEQSLVEHWRQKGKSEEEILQLLREFS